MSKDVILFGTGSFAELAHHYLEHDSQFSVGGFTVDEEYLDSDEFRGLPAVPFEDLEESFPPASHRILVAVGYRKVNETRREKYLEAKRRGYETISYLNSQISYWGTGSIGENCFIFEDQTIQPFVDIGDNVVLWSGNHIGHHSSIGDHCFLTSHVVVSGHSEIRDGAFIGVNATLADGVTIAENCVIGAGAVVVDDTEPDSTYVGNPARKIKADSTESEI